MLRYSPCMILFWVIRDNKATCPSFNTVKQKHIPNRPSVVLRELCPYYRASQKTWYRPWFVHSWLFSTRKFKIQIHIFNEYFFSSNIYFLFHQNWLCTFEDMTFFPKIRGIAFFPRMTILRIKSNSRFKVVLHFIYSLFFVKCLHALFANQVLFSINPITKLKQKPPLNRWSWKYLVLIFILDENQKRQSTLYIS